MDYTNKNLQGYFFKSLYNNLEMIIYTSVCFFVPFFLGHPQLLVGIIVNAALILSALNLKGYKLLPVIIAPALGAFSRGLIFGPYTIYLMYMIPFIWLGNALLVFCFKYFKLKLGKNYLFTLIIGALLKSGFLFLMAFLLYNLGIIPIVFLTAMGIIQLTTAFAGGIAAYGINKIKNFYF